MDGFLRKHAVRLMGLALALIALASLLSFHAQDPTLTNLRYPKDGIGNWAGYGGALIGGSFVEAFGLATLLLPLLLANVLMVRRGRSAWYRYTLHAFALLLIAAAALGMTSDAPTLGLRGPGLLGWSAGQWMRTTVGPWAAGFMLAFAGLYSLAQVAYAPQLRRVFTDARVLSRYGVRQLFAQAVNWWRQARPQTGWAWHEIAVLPFAGAAFAAGWIWERAVLRPLVRPVRVATQGLRERRYSVARVKRMPVAPMPSPMAFQSGEPTRYGAPVAGPVPDAFAEWMDTPEPDRPIVSHPPAPPLDSHVFGAPVVNPPMQPRPAPLPMSPAPERPPMVPSPMAPLPTDAPGTLRGADRVARWEEYLQRYKENLDLDWDERSWKRKRLEDLAQDSEDGDVPRPPAGK